MSRLLSQEEIDALMNAQATGDNPGSSEELVLPGVEAGSSAEAINEDASPNLVQLMTLEEIDALGEVGNISMGSASTTLSEILSQKVNITSPKVKIITKAELFDSFVVPYLVIKVDFSEGINGYNLLIIRLEDAATMASLMMGGDGTPMSEEISEMEISAASEAMNMMIGTSATSLSQMFHRPINISPPESTLLRTKDDPLASPPEKIEDTIVVVSFNMTIGDLVDTEIMQIMSVETAKEEASLLLMDLVGGPPEQVQITESAIPEQEFPEQLEELAIDVPDEITTQEPLYTSPSPMVNNETLNVQQPAAKAPSLGSLEQRNLELILDIPLKVSVVLGRTKRPIKDVLKIAPGTVVELNTLANEPVEVLVNGTLVATGEVVVVNENFGVRLTNIISPIERIKRLGS
ncbi:flagellar motor switch phosphatase FliY [Desulforamulus aquiferis]|uniref:Flagellar motor switch phosphatase FliY n=1 Tax=Desulforamulus aquiferis TaxID=1397668 RepID=A0AAW7ZF67_9FIRM|nr:flagellar motor switch phosphatase FliY [Desulforamulus aquiferis]MDO7788393.1 flagellar motor switch phosphatase FliY [Desulforamulus aquiferis]